MMSLVMREGGTPFSQYFKLVEKRMKIQTKICVHGENCVHGNVPQPITNFYKDDTKSDGYRSTCKDCARKQRKNIKIKNIEAHQNMSDAEIREQTPLKRCARGSCLHKNELQPSENFNICRSSKDGLSHICKDCHRKCSDDLKEKRKKESKAQIEFLICTYKECSHNGNPQPVENFSKSFITETGYDIYCKECRKKIRSSFAKYDRYAENLSIFEEIRKDPENSELLQVKCYNSKCGKWFNPKVQMVQERLKSFNGGPGESHFYCCDDCKNTCSVYNLKPNQIIKKKDKCNHHDNLQSDLREIVLKLDNYTCQLCEKSVNEFPDIILICHHIKPRVTNLMLSADVDNCITLCEECHKKVHSLPGCQLHELQKKAQEQRENNQLK